MSNLNLYISKLLFPVNQLEETIPYEKFQNEKEAYLIQIF